MRNGRETKKRADRITISFEKSENRIATMYEKDGYDILSKGENQVRYIEVKGISSKYVSRWLENKQFKMLKNKDFYIYLITEIYKNPTLYIFNGTKDLKIQIVPMYRINLGKKDLNNLKGINCRTFLEKYTVEI